jgi:O-antigen/teichoic acid export membrane protein
MRTFGYLALGEAVTGLIRFGAMLWVARTLGPSGFGVIGVGLAVAGYVVMAHAGMEAVGVRRVAGDRGDTRRHIEELVGVRLALAVGLYGLMALTMMAVPAGDEVRRVILVYSLSLFTLAIDLRWWFVATEETRPVAMAATASAALYLAGVISFVRDPHDLLIVPVLHVVAELASATLLGAWARRRFGSFRPRLKATPWARNLRESAPLSGIKVARAVMLGFDVVALKIVAGSAEAGQYAAARRFALVGMIFVGLYFNAFLPRLVKVARDSPRAGNALLRTAWLRSAVLMIPVGVVGSLIAGPTVVLLLGSDYQEAGSALAWLVWTVVLASLIGPFQQALIARDAAVSALVATTAAAVAAVGLAVILIPRYSLIGAAVAAVVAEAVRLAGSVFAVRRTEESLVG